MTVNANIVIVVPVSSQVLDF